MGRWVRRDSHLPHDCSHLRLLDHPLHAVRRQFLCKFQHENKSMASEPCASAARAPWQCEDCDCEGYRAVRAVKVEVQVQAQAKAPVQAPTRSKTEDDPPTVDFATL